MLIWALWYFWFTRFQYHQNIQNIQTINDEVDNIILSWNWESAITGINFSGAMKDISLDISMASWTSLEELKRAYTDALFKSDYKQQLDVLEQLYVASKDTNLLYILVDKSLELYDFPKALHYMKDLYAVDKDLQKWDTKRFIYAMINSLNTDEQTFQDLKNLIREYEQKRLIDMEDRVYYFSLMDMLRWDHELVMQDISYLNSTKYQKYKEQLQNLYNQYTQAKDSPSYYLEAMFAFAAFGQWYFRVSDSLSTEILKYNSDYILPMQLLAYSSMLQWRWETSNEYLKKLIDIDYENQQLYKFLLWISHYWQQQYYDAVLYFSQVENSPYQNDVHRYLLLSYFKLEDIGNISQQLSMIAKFRSISEYDYYTIFHLVFYEQWQIDSKHEIFNKNVGIVYKLLQSCFNSLTTQNHYVCRYGKAWFHLARGEDEKAFQYLLYLSRFYPRPYIFQKIAQYYEAKWSLDKAKYYYTQAIVYTNDVNQKQDYKQQLLDLILKK